MHKCSIEVVEEPNFESTGQWGIYENYDNGADWIRAVDEGKFVATILTPGPLSADLQLWTMALLYVPYIALLSTTQHYTAGFVVLLNKAPRT